MPSLRSVQVLLAAYAEGPLVEVLEELVGPIIAAIEAGHIGTLWDKNKDADLKVLEVPQACKKCNQVWPCEAIRHARKKQGPVQRGRK